jgi:hypothetical protein
MTIRKHHCRICGLVVCSRCSPNRVALKTGDPVRVRLSTMLSFSRMTVNAVCDDDACFVFLGM